MSSSNYALCEVCNQKAYYDAGTIYGDAEHAALCDECAKSYRLVALVKESSLTSFEVEAILYRMEQRRAYERGMEAIRETAERLQSPEFKAWLAGDRSVWGGPPLGESND